MRRRTIAIAEPQQWNFSLGRSLNAGGVNDGADGSAPAAQAGLRLKRSSASRWRCLQLGWSKPKKSQGPIQSGTEQADESAT